MIWVTPPDRDAGIYPDRCHRAADGPLHQPDLPDLTDPVEIEAWLDGVREGLDP